MNKFYVSISVAVLVLLGAYAGFHSSDKPNMSIVGSGILGVCGALLAVALCVLLTRAVQDRMSGKRVCVFSVEDLEPGPYRSLGYVYFDGRNHYVVVPQVEEREEWRIKPFVLVDDTQAIPMEGIFHVLPSRKVVKAVEKRPS